MPTTAVVIPTFNRRATLVQGLARLFQVLPETHVVIVVDAGSSDGTRDTVTKDFPRVVLIEGNPSMWWAAATNRGIARARELGCSYVITYNDDNLATPTLFRILTEAAQNNPHSIIGAVCCYADRTDTVFFAGRLRARGTDRFYYLDHDKPLSSLARGLRRVDMLHGMCTLFPLSVFDKVALFNEQEFPQVFADDDLLMRAGKAGFILQVALDAVVVNDRTKTGINPYDRRMGPRGIFQLLVSRKSTFQLAARTRFLWRYRRSFFLFCKTWLFDYCRLFAVLVARWVLPFKTFHWIGIHWGRQLHNR